MPSLEQILEDVVPEGTCVEWPKAKTPMGYGVTWKDGKNAYAHRVAYEQAKGPIPDKHEIDHLCRNPSCVNPEHLEAVTKAENQRRGKNAKFSAKDIEAIRASGLHPDELAKLYDTTPKYIRVILRRERWSDA